MSEQEQQQENGGGQLVEAAGSMPLKKSGALDPTTFEDAWRMAKVMAASEFVPKDYRNKPENVLVAVQMGAEVGLKPMQALQNIAVINGRPSVWGDAALALVLASDKVNDVQEDPPCTDNDWTATCTVYRIDRQPVARKFSLEEAQTAGLAQRPGEPESGKAGPWRQYRNRMIQLRARGFALRDGCADILKGLQVAEESIDIPSGARVVAADDVVDGLNAALAPPAPLRADDPAQAGLSPTAAEAGDVRLNAAEPDAPESAQAPADAAQAEPPPDRTGDTAPSEPAAAPSAPAGDPAGDLAGPTVDDVVEALRTADTVDKLDEAEDLIRSLGLRKGTKAARQLQELAAEARERLGLLS